MTSTDLQTIDLSAMMHNVCVPIDSRGDGRCVICKMDDEQYEYVASIRAKIAENCCVFISGELHKRAPEVRRRQDVDGESDERVEENRVGQGLQSNFDTSKCIEAYEDKNYWPEVIGKHHRGSKIMHHLCKTERSTDEKDVILMSLLLCRDRASGDEVYGRIMATKDRSQYYISIVSTDKKNNISAKTSIYKTSTHILDNLMVVDNTNDEGIVFFTQVQREEDNKLSQIIELVCLVRSVKRYKVTIKAKSVVNNQPSVFQICNTRRSLAVYIPQTILGLFYNLHGQDVFHKMKERYIGISLKDEKFKHKLVKVCLEEKRFESEILNQDILYVAMAFDNGEIYVKLISKSTKQETEYKVHTDAKPLVTREGEFKGEIKNIFFKPTYSVLIVVSETNEGDIIVEAYSLVFNEDGTKITKFVRNHNYYVISRAQELGLGRDMELIYKTMNVDIDRSIELIILPENLTKSFIYKIKYDRDSRKFCPVQSDALKIQFKKQIFQGSNARPPIGHAQPGIMNRANHDILDRANQTDDEMDDVHNIRPADLDDRLSVRANDSLDFDALANVDIFSEAGSEIIDNERPSGNYNNRLMPMYKMGATLMQQPEGSKYMTNADYTDMVANTHSFLCIEGQCMVTISK